MDGVDRRARGVADGVGRVQERLAGVGHLCERTRDRARREYRLLPVDNEVPYLGLLIIDPDAAQTVTLAAQMVPFPLMIEPGARLRTALFNGTAELQPDPFRRDPLRRKRCADRRVGQRRPPSTSPNPRSIYYDAELKTRVEAFANRSASTPCRDCSPGESAVDITVTLGADFKA